MTKPLKYRFEISYQTPHIKKASDFMTKLDLGTKECFIKDVLTFEYTKEEKPIQYFKDILTKAFVMMDYTLIHIEGGKIE